MKGDDLVLAALREAEGFLSGQQLGGSLGMSRAAIWKHVAALRNAGCRIESRPGLGYRLLQSPELLQADDVTSRLTSSVFGRELLCLSSTGSTNDELRRLAREGRAEGLAVVADEQTAGRGRLGRQWVSTAGVNLYLSLLLRPGVAPAEAPQLALLAAVAVALGLEDLGLEPEIKWPNDVLLKGAKVCGILTEMEAEADRVDFVVVGVGVNLNSRASDFPPELRDKATSVLMHSGAKVDRAAFLADLLSHFELLYEQYTAGGFAAIRGQWEMRCVMIGRKINVNAGGRIIGGICEGIDTDGALLVKGRKHEPAQRVLAGDVTVLDGYMKARD